MNPVLRVLSGTRLTPPPVWMMRQAGRYLPEYRALREKKGSFLSLVTDSAAAAEITLQPVERFGFDVAILFSDILIVPLAMGQKLSFREGEGPQLAPPLGDAVFSALAERPQAFAPIFETVRQVRARLAPERALFGFAGAPFTVSTYMVAGGASRDHAETRLLAYRDSGRFAALIEAVGQHTLSYLSGQIEAGADAVMLFDSWAGSLAAAEFERWVVAPTARLVAALRERYPSVPVLGFPRGAGEKAPAYARETGITALCLDERMDLSFVLKNTPDSLPLQGNLDPMVLKAGGEPLRAAVADLLHTMGGRPHIFNLGHGIDRFTPIAHVDAMLRQIRESTAA